MNDPAAPTEVPPAAVPPPAPPAPPPAATWPAWVTAADVAVGLVVVAAAFLAAGFAARNSDAFPHFAAGRLIAQGQYSFGSDPFAAGQSWANTSWLYDLGAYLMYNANPTGAAVVAVKAVVFAAMFAVVLLFRRAGEPGWPYWLFAALGAVAAATHAQLRPLVGSGLFLAVTLFVLFRLEWKPGSWRNAGLLAALFWLWAGVDGWFVLGPAAVLLALVGELVQGKGAADPSSPPLPVPALAKALGLGVLACTLTPNHVNVWRLPPDLAITFAASEIVKTDPQFAAAFRSPLSEAYLEDPRLGENAGGYAFLVLLGLSGAAVFAGVVFLRLRAAYLLLWVLLALAAAQQYRLILLFAATAAPLAATAVAAAAGRLTLGPADRPATRVLLLAAGLGRVLGLGGAAFLAAAGFAGWLHPEPGLAAYASRFGPKVEPEPSYTRAAKRLEDWRAAGRLPAEFKGLHLSPQFGDYLTWFAPGEPPFVTTRYMQHLAVLPDVARATKLTRLRGNAEDDPVAELTTVLKNHPATYLVLTPGTGMVPPEGPLGLVLDLTAPGGGYAIWHVDGRSAVLGRLEMRSAAPAAFDGLAFDPVRLAFDPATEPLPEPPPPTAPLPPREWSDDFVGLPAPPPPEAADATVWFTLAAAAYERLTPAAVFANAAVAGPVPVALVQMAGRFPPSPPSDTVVALKLLAARAARRATAANPDAADGYKAVATAIGQPAATPFTLPGTPPQESRGVFIAAARAYLDRRPAAALSPAAAFDARQYARALAEAFARPEVGMLSEAREMRRREREYLLAYARALDPKAVEAEVKQLDAVQQKLDEERAARYEGYAQQAGRMPQPVQRLQLAAAAGLLDKAKDEYEAAAAGGAGPEAALLLASAYLRAGKMVEGAELIGVAGEAMERAGGQVPGPLRAAFQAQLDWLWRMIGDYKKTGEAAERSAPPPLNALGRKLVADAAAAPDAWDAALTGSPPAHGGTGGVFGLLLAADVAANGRLPSAQAVQLWMQASNFFLDRGRLLLLEGKVGEAKERFRQALRPDSQGPELPAFAPQRPVIEQYLRLIAAGEQGR